MVYSLIGLLALVGICSAFTALGLVARRLLEDEGWILDWDTFGGGIIVALILAAVYGVSYGLGYAIVHHVWQKF